MRALEFYGMAPTIIVPDNPKIGVTRADRYEPELQRSYEELAAHYRAVQPEALCVPCRWF